MLGRLMSKIKLIKDYRIDILNVCQTRLSSTNRLISDVRIKRVKQVKNIQPYLLRKLTLW